MKHGQICIGRLIDTQHVKISILGIKHLKIEPYIIEESNDLSNQSSKIVRVSSYGRITIPAIIRAKSQINYGDILEVTFNIDNSFELTVLENIPSN